MFGKSADTPTSGRKSKLGTPKKDPPLPPVAKRLIRCLKSKEEGKKLKMCVTLCASVMTDAQIRVLPEDARKLVAERKAVIEQRKKL